MKYMVWLDDPFTTEADAVTVCAPTAKEAVMVWVRREQSWDSFERAYGSLKRVYVRTPGGGLYSSEVAFKASSQVSAIHTMECHSCRAYGQLYEKEVCPRCGHPCEIESDSATTPGPNIFQTIKEEDSEREPSEEVLARPSTGA